MTMLVTEEELGESEDNQRAIWFLEESLRFNEEMDVSRRPPLALWEREDGGDIERGGLKIDGGKKVEIVGPEAL